MKKPRKQTYTLGMYLDKMKDFDIRNDADTQRDYIWTKEQANELIYTVLTEDYVPAIILGEENNSQLWIIDGGQRSVTFMRFRYGNYKINSSIEDPVITYKTKKRDKKGAIVHDEDGSIIWEDATFNIKNKTYDDLPDELKKRFNEYQLETVIHEDCDKKRIAKLIKRYNNHSSMNVAQKAFTYIDDFANQIRKIINGNFFKNYGVYTENEKSKGALERVVMETAMCSYHMEDWKKSTKTIAAYLNENATKEEFLKIEDNLSRLAEVMNEEVNDVFNSKDSFIWLTLFNKFTKYELDDVKFVDFLKAFKEELREVEVDGMSFAKADENKGTKDKSVIAKKLQILETLMVEFLHINKEDFEQVDVLEFIKETVDENITDEDIEVYKEDLEVLTLDVDNDSKLLDKNNLPSLLAIIAHSYKEDIAIDEWFVGYFNSHNSFVRNQNENFLNMRSDLETYVARMEAA